MVPALFQIEVAAALARAGMLDAAVTAFVDRLLARATGSAPARSSASRCKRGSEPPTRRMRGSRVAREYR